MNKILDKFFDQGVVSGERFGFLSVLVLGFLAFNLVIRFCTIFNYPPYNGYIGALFGGVVSGCIFVIFFQRYLKAFLFLFGFSFFLFGFGSIDLQSRVFELIVTCVVTTLFVLNWRGGRERGQIRRLRKLDGLGEKEKDGEQRKGISRKKAQKLKKEKDLTTEKMVSHRAHGEHREGRDNAGVNPREIRSAVVNEFHGVNRHLVVLILCYVGLSLFSLLLLPVRQIVKDLWFFGFPDSFYYLFIGPPYGFQYPVVAVIRLMLFVVLAIQLSITMRCQDNYKWLFSGIFSGAVFCAFIGLLDFYGVISLAAYRFGTASPGVLHSTFGNRGWFAEFILTVVPFVLIGFMSKIKGAWWKILLFSSLVICEIALILAGARAGWVSYPLILAICWLFFYFSKEGRIDSFHFRWRDLVKVAVSVPITIVISFVLIFYVLMPLSDYMKEHSNVKGMRKSGEATGQFIQRQAGRLLDPGKRGRLYTWGEGYNVGRESPLFGMSYESFCWHANILADLPESYCNEFYREARSIHQTPHNVFFSIFSSGGVIGVCLWLLIVGYSVVILIFDLIRNKRLLNTPVIISIISFHIYGIFQSMQYIPMIWLLIFLCLGYAMTIDERVLSGRVRRVMGVVTKVSVVLVVISLFVYLTNFESRGLADKYGLKIYAMDQDRDRFGGFFQHSKRWKYGDYRWCGKRGSVVIRSQRSEVGSREAGKDDKKDGWMNGGMDEKKGKNGGEGAEELEFYCRTPGVGKEPVVLKVFHDGKVIDTITFAKEGAVRRRYGLPEVPGKEQELLLEVSRTWVPHDVLENFDRRELGVGVKIHKR